MTYKYNAKELDRMHGLMLYDYGARMYDPQLCRFATVDPLTDQYQAHSPYAYCVNNPVAFVDPDGMSVQDYEEEDLGDYYNLHGQYIGHDGKNDNMVYFVEARPDDPERLRKAYTGEYAKNALAVMSVEGLKKTTECMGLTETKEQEFGFVVAEDGSTSSMMSGGSGSIILGPGYEELQHSGKKTMFDVHSHPFGYRPNGDGTAKYSSTTPSGDDKSYYSNKLVNHAVTRNSWIVGHDPVFDSNGCLTLNPAGEINSIKVVRFYNHRDSQGMMLWESFVKVVNGYF